jgi:1-acyl-sn-glycerol-3-phosphate acyltransferase
MEEKESEFYISPTIRFLTAVARFVCYPLVDFFLKVINRSRAIGLENISGLNGGVAFASNHVSGVDTLLIPIFAAKRFSIEPFCAPGKEELFKIPVVGLILRIWGSFPVKRRSRDLKSMRRISYYCQHYRTMLFPEGTRTKTGELGKGRSGAGWVIYNAKTTVIPTLVINTENYFWPGRKRPWFQVPYTVVFGAPLNLDRFYAMPDGKETSQAIVEEVMKAIAALKEKHKDLQIEQWSNLEVR